MGGMTMPTINVLREQIDEIDRQLQDLFLRRMNLVAEVSELKQNEGLPIADPDREKKMYHDRMESLDGSPFAPHYRRFFECILHESKTWQEERRKRP